MDDMEAIYAWTEFDPDGGEGVIITFIPMLGFNATLQSRRLDIAEKLRPVAENHQKTSGHVVRLVKFTRAETLETITTGMWKRGE